MFEADVADKVTWCDAEHVTQFGVQCRTAHASVGSQLVHSVCVIVHVRLDGMQHLFDKQFLLAVYSYFLRVDAGGFRKLMACFFP